MRVADTFGAHPGLVADMGRACCDGMQSDLDRDGNWGSGSVSTMAKHWPGGGPCEAGRDAHYAFGKFAVHPGGEQVGNSYSKYIIGDLLRQQAGFEGVVCTDWGITGGPEREMDSFGSRCYGVEHLTEAERHLRILENGVDQFGGNNDIVPILEACRLGCEKYGEEAISASV